MFKELSNQEVFMVRLFLVSIVSVAGCTATPGVSTEVLQQLSVACVGGDASACDSYSALYDSRQKQPVVPVYVPPVAPLQQFPQMQGTQRTVCQPQYGQQIVCRTY